MSFSNTYIYQLTRDQLITAALRKLGVLSEGQVPSAQNLADGQVALNSVIAQLRTIGMPLWARREYTFIPTQSAYSIGPGQPLNTPQPLKILHAFRTENNAKIPLEVIAKEDYNALPISYGKPLKLNYQPVLNGGIISLWPYPTATETVPVTIVYSRPFQYMTTGTDNLDFPDEWYNAIIYSTAVILAPEWQVPLPDRQALKAEAKEYVDAALLNSGEDASLFIQPERRM